MNTFSSQTPSNYAVYPVSSPEYAASSDANITPLVSGRWIPLKVLSVGGVSLLQQAEPFAVHVKIDVTLPYNVPESQLAPWIQNETTLISEDVTVNFGVLTDVTRGGLESLLLAPSPKKFSIVVPLKLSVTAKPFADRIDTTGKVSRIEIVHHTILLPGLENNKQTVWRIRVKANHTEKRAQLISTGTSPVDMPRVNESWTNFKSFCNQKYDQLSQKISNKPRSETQGQPPTMPQV